MLPVPWDSCGRIGEFATCCCSAVCSMRLRWFKQIVLPIDLAKWSLTSQNSSGTSIKVIQHDSHFPSGKQTWKNRTTYPIVYDLQKWWCSISFPKVNFFFFNQLFLQVPTVETTNFVQLLQSVNQLRQHRQHHGLVAHRLQPARAAQLARVQRQLRAQLGQEPRQWGAIASSQVVTILEGWKSGRSKVKDRYKMI